MGQWRRGEWERGRHGHRGVLRPRTEKITWPGQGEGQKTWVCNRGRWQVVPCQLLGGKRWYGCQTAATEPMHWRRDTEVSAKKQERFNCYDAMLLSDQIAKIISIKIQTELTQMTRKLAEKGQGGQVKKAVCPVIHILWTHLEQVQQTC